MDFTAIQPSQASLPVSERDRAAEGSARASEADGTGPRDRVTISSEARSVAQGAASGTKDTKLSSEQQRQVAFLQQRDASAGHAETTYQAARGSLTSSASLTYPIGSDGRSNAAAGEASVRRAAPASSGSDLSVTKGATARKARRATEAYGKQTRRAAEQQTIDEAGGASYQGSLKASDDESGGTTLVAA